MKKPESLQLLPLNNANNTAHLAFMHQLSVDYLITSVCARKETALNSSITRGEVSHNKSKVQSRWKSESLLFFLKTIKNFTINFS